MGTRGTIELIAGEHSFRVYNHYDSYPTYLGVDLAKFVRDSNPDLIAGQIALVEKVNESDTCPESILATFKSQGIWQDVSTGTDWYSALRGVQGDLAGYLSIGFVPHWEHGDTEEWGYSIDYNTRIMTITSQYGFRQEVPFVAFTDDSEIMEMMTRYESY